MLTDTVIDYDYQPPEYIDASASIENLVIAIKNSLQYWLDIHTNPVAWANEWTECEDWKYLLESQPILENNYFTFDLEAACSKQLAKEYIHDNEVIRCTSCNCLLFQGWDCEECDNPDYDSLSDDDLEELTEWLQDMGIDSDGIQESIIRDAMIYEGFQVYQDALESTIRSVVEEVQEALQRYDTLETNEDRLFWAMNASAILHINGNICTDYGDRIGLDYQFVCSYRDNGLESVFSKEEIREYINGGNND